MSTATVAPDALTAHSSEALALAALLLRMATCSLALDHALALEDHASRAQAAMSAPQPVRGELPEETAARLADAAYDAADNAHVAANFAHHHGGGLLRDIDAVFHGGYPASNAVIAAETGLAAEARNIAEQCQGLRYTPWPYPGSQLETIALDACVAAVTARIAHLACHAIVEWADDNEQSSGAAIDLDSLARAFHLARAAIADIPPTADTRGDANTACRELVEWCDESERTGAPARFSELDATVTLARAAIAKATGE